MSLKTKILLLVILPLLFLLGFVAVMSAQVEHKFAEEQECILTAMNDPGLSGIRIGVEDCLARTNENVSNTFHHILLLLALTMLAIMLLMWRVNLHESRMADRHLRELVHNFIRLQVEERRYFAHELHDGINQMIGAAKFRVELAARQLTKGKGDYQESLGKAQETLAECMGKCGGFPMGCAPACWMKWGWKRR
ncbi:MAG: hypothetical protein HZT40_16985 [Candidatus Thiothrix singaporensis]|uniref:Signal transduction histidine kinase subgroup 3 dimerisation and phosphoacceptor domain-containing protein n=1 Tax=Candidatus Thiothrix singaporensis TaxID=2799669 RepID=A0A7L6AV78_9GAMM|nr:MAG: hypothetical protein HZT40_16985 [Candidatus Thiothrix singaporensis]